MAYKIMGVTAGRKNSNSEILLKEALMACEELGAEVRMINLKDFHIEPCTGCTSCTRGMAQGKNVGCVLDKKDDKRRIMDVLLDQDAVIYSAPTYDLVSPEELRRIVKRRKLLLGHDRGNPVGFIGRAWQSMALEAMQATMFTTDFKVVDMILGTRVPGRAQCLLNDELVARAHKMGENIMKAVATPPEERTWLGDEDMGWCPNCHSNALVLGEPQWDGIYYPIECQVCGCGGTLEKTPEGKWKFVIQENGYYKDRTTVIGRARHLEEIGHTEGGFYANPENLKVVNEKLAKYKDKQFPGLD